MKKLTVKEIQIISDKNRDLIAKAQIRLYREFSNNVVDFHLISKNFTDVIFGNGIKFEAVINVASSGNMSEEGSYEYFKNINHAQKIYNDLVRLINSSYLIK